MPVVAIRPSIKWNVFDKIRIVLHKSRQKKNSRSKIGPVPRLLGAGR